MTPKPLTAIEKLDHITECPDGCGVCKLMAADVRARIAELEAEVERLKQFEPSPLPKWHMDY